VEFFRSITTTVALIIGLAQIGCCQGSSTPDLPPAQNLPGSTSSSSDINRSINLKSVVPNIFEDQKRIYWTFPGQVAHGKHWIPVVGVLAATAGLIAADQFDAPSFRRTSTYHGFNNAFSGTNTTLGILIAPLSMYGVGLITKNSYAQDTALLSGEAVADSEILDEVLKLSTRRARPSAIAPHGNFADTWFDSNTITDGGFPSGHTIAAFSLATIVSERYGRHHRWVPYVAYGLAGAVGFSRVTLSAHFPSDVFVGAAFGYAISHFAVLHATRAPGD
jgi:membrane-associated phospholipid phosphatase